MTDMMLKSCLGVRVMELAFEQSKGLRLRNIFSSNADNGIVLFPLHRVQEAGACRDSSGIVDVRSRHGFI